MTMITRGRFVSDVLTARNLKMEGRIPLPFFIGLAKDVGIEVVESCEEPDRAREKYEGVKAREWLRKRLLDVKLARQANGTH